MNKLSLHHVARIEVMVISRSRRTNETATVAMVLHFSIIMSALVECLAVLASVDTITWRIAEWLSPAAWVSDLLLVWQAINSPWGREVFYVG